MSNICALLIAAGVSNRMGTPKQLLPWGTKTLIEHQIEILLKSNFFVTVVLGANYALIQQKIEKLKIQIIHNKNWENGMGTSIACGAKQVSTNANSFDGIMVTLVDQPLITTEHYQNLKAPFEPGKNQIIVSQSESGIQSAPVLFDSSYLNELMELDGENGAKPITKKYRENIVLVTCKSSLEDMDTPEAYQKLLALTNHQS